MVAVAAGEMEDPRREVPRAVHSVVFRIGVFYVGSILLLVSMLPTGDYRSGTSPFVSVFDRLGFHAIGDVVQAILIIAAMSSLNSGLYSTGRVLRSLGMAKQAPGFTMRMSPSGVPYAGILMTSVVYALGAILNAVAPGSAFDIALECASIGVLATWASIFVCQIRLRQLSDHGVVPPSSFRAPGSPYTSIIGLVFIFLVLLGMAVSGWQEAPGFWHKTDFIVVVLGLPVIAIVLTVGWRVVRPRVLADTNGQLGSRWTLNGPRYGESNVPA